MFPSALAAASSAEQSAEERAAAAVRITLTLCSYHLFLPGETIVLPRQARDENVQSISQLNKESGVFFFRRPLRRRGCRCCRSGAACELTTDRYVFLFGIVCAARLVPGDIMLMMT
jgi:hypothetical protein